MSIACLEKWCRGWSPRVGAAGTRAWYVLEAMELVDPRQWPMQAEDMLPDNMRRIAEIVLLKKFVLAWSKSQVVARRAQAWLENDERMELYAEWTGVGRAELQEQAWQMGVPAARRIIQMMRDRYLFSTQQQREKRWRGMAIQIARATLGVPAEALAAEVWSGEPLAEVDQAVCGEAGL